MNSDVGTLIHSYAHIKGLRRRYVSLVSTADLTEAYLLLFVNERKWRATLPSAPLSEAIRSKSFFSMVAASNCTNAAAASTVTTEPTLKNGDTTNGIQTCPSVRSMPLPSRNSLCTGLSTDNSVLTDQLAAVENVCKGFKYISLDGLFFVGVTQTGPKLSVTSALKSAFGKILQLKKPPESSLDPETQQMKEVTVATGPAHSALFRRLQVNESDSASVSTVQWPVSMASEACQRPRSAYFGSAGTQRDEETDDLPSVVLSSNSFSADSKSSMVDFVEVSPASIGLYFEDGSYTVMSFSSKDVFVSWLQVLSAVVAVNRVRRSFPHIEYASTVTCKFKAKESNAGPFPKIRGECLFCLSKLDVILVSTSVKNPDLSIRFPYVRRCASRDDGRLCLDIGRAAPTGECQLVLQMCSAKEAKIAHTRCITLMSHCSTWLKLGRDGPSSRRQTIPNLGQKSSSIKLAGPPLPRFPTGITDSQDTAATNTSPPENVITQPVLPTSLLLPNTPFSPSRLSVLLGTKPELAVVAANFPPSICHKSCSFPTRLHESIPELDPPICSASSTVERSHSEPFSDEQTHEEHSAPLGALKSSVFSPFSWEADLSQRGSDSAPSTSHPPSPGIHSGTAKETEPITGLTSNPKPEVKVIGSSTSPSDITDHYLHLSLGTQGLMGPHIKRITKYPRPPGRTESADEDTEVPSEETIRRVLAFLAGIARQSNTGDSSDPSFGELQQPVTRRSSTPSVTSAVSLCPPTLGEGVENSGLVSRPPLLSPVFTDPSSVDAKRFEQSRYLPGSSSALVRDFAYYTRESIYLDPVLEGNQLRNPLTNGSNVQGEATYIPSGANVIPFVADKKSFGNLLLKADSTSTTMSANIAAACTPTSLIKPVQLRHQRSKRNHRTRIYSHRDNDEIFADLTYEANAGDARNRGPGIAATVGLSVSGRSSTSFESKNPSFLLDLQQRSALQIIQQQLVAVSVSANGDQRPRTASDTSNWKRQALTSCQSDATAVTTAAAGCSWDLRPRARSLTHHLGGGKPLSQPIHVKDLSTRLRREGSYLVKPPAPTPVPVSDTTSSRSNSSTSASKHIIRAIEHVLGRSRSTTTTTVEEVGVHLSTNSQTGAECSNSTATPVVNGLTGEKRTPQLSEIYAEMDFGSPTSPAIFSTVVPTLQPPVQVPVSTENVEPSTPTVKPPINTLRDSALLVTPSGSLSSTSSLSYDAGGGGSVLNPGTTHSATRHPQTATVVDFNDPYDLFSPLSDNRFVDRPLPSFFTAMVTKKSLATPRNFT